ncbi:MAG: deoxyribodipyrimidine photo-lyase [Bacteroidota bacterium]
MKEINVVWFKRDLRLSDHEPLFRAIEDGKPVVLVTFLEPSLMAAPQSDIRHWRFVHQSFKEIEQRLKAINQKIHLIQAEVVDTFSIISRQYQINQIFTYAETGIELTYNRDKEVAEFCKREGIKWVECPYSGVIRGMKKRDNWPKHWYGIMAQPTHDPDLGKLESVNLDQAILNEIGADSIAEEVLTDDPHFQKGGELLARKYLSTFLNERVSNYNKHISKPAPSRKSCSRLSPYLAWGNISMKQVYQATVEAKKSASQKRNINSFSSRLRWHCHFIQKFEMEHRYEYENLNKGFDGTRDEWDEEKYLAWENGLTGYPLVDACIRCVKTTGYINFRMRSMIVSFLTHHLWLDWKRGADFLARQFLDFEPGIHYPQFQMQAGTTGYNTIRIYNPVKQSLENDADGEFIKQWMPEIAHLPLPLLHEPWKMTAIDEQLHGVKLGIDYPQPIVDTKVTYKEASSKLWKKKGDQKVKRENRRILAKHTN